MQRPDPNPQQSAAAPLAAAFVRSPPDLPWCHGRRPVGVGRRCSTSPPPGERRPGGLTLADRGEAELGAREEQLAACAQFALLGGPRLRLLGPDLGTARDELLDQPEDDAG